MDAEFDSPGCLDIPDDKGLTKAQAPIFGFGVDPRPGQCRPPDHAA
jgi:hypothetical protein